MHYSLHSDFMGACWYPRGALKVSGRFSMVSVVLDGYWSFSLVSFENCRYKWTCCVFDTCIENPLCTYFSAVILIHILNDCWIELLLITFIIWIIIELTPDHDFLTLTHCAHSFQVQSMPMWAFCVPDGRRRCLNVSKWSLWWRHYRRWDFRPIILWLCWCLTSRCTDAWLAVSNASV